PSATAANKPANVRTQNACDACRISKSKCDGGVPCGRCQSKQLACTSSRPHPKAMGPISGEHVATLQAQQRRLTLAVSAMASVIKQAESRGFVEDDSKSGATVAPLSSTEMAQTLQRFAPEDSIAATVDPPPGNLDSESKKRKLCASNGPTFDSDIQMADYSQSGGSAKDPHPFEKFVTTVQRRSIGNPMSANPVSTAANQPFSVANEGLDMMDSSVPAFEFHPQLAPFVDLIDWDASLEHFLDTQSDGENSDWAKLDAFNVPDTTS
ncbi:hypothetical protein BDY17DRAFT_258898, partial [Neohortaea acidophila]